MQLLLFALLPRRAHTVLSGKVLVDLILRVSSLYLHTFFFGQSALLAVQFLRLILFFFHRYISHVFFFGIWHASSVLGQLASWLGVQSITRIGIRNRRDVWGLNPGHLVGIIRSTGKVITRQGKQAVLDDY